ncbi:hypothetical protein VNI00_000540 [Paramarasmius palmivorus]|uniref:RING-type domain-containing protein n=1 Tax=Paramarasmius palmivorus TaxID=297713 RepID=A0AAW0E9I5_9AGAR
MRSSAHSTEELSDPGQKVKQMSTSAPRHSSSKAATPASSALQAKAQTSKKDKGKERAASHSHTHSHSQPRSSKHFSADESEVAIIGYSGPIAVAEFERMKKEIEELKNTIQEQKKTIKKQTKKMDELKAEVASGKSAKKEQDTQIQALSSKVNKGEETIRSIETHLSCQICMEIMNKPFALSPCGHVLCMPCLQDWFRKAPPSLDDMDIDPEDADDPEYLKYRQKSCPCCRAVIERRPAPLFVLKSVVNAVQKHKCASENAASSSTQRSDSPLVGEEDPWEGLFPDDEHEGDMGDEDEGYLRHYYEHGLYLDSDSDGIESIMIEVDSDAESLDEGEVHHHGEEDLSDAESLDPLYVKPSWEPPIATYSREELAHLTPAKAAMLLRGGTLWMIQTLHMDYTHRDGFIVYLFGLDNVHSMPYENIYRLSAQERRKRNLHRIFLGWNIRGAREGLIEEGGKEFMNELLDSFRTEHWRFHVEERSGGKLDVHVLVQADDSPGYDTTDTEAYY